MITDIREVTECPDCASSNIVHNLQREQVICRECGLIYEPLTPAEETKFEQAHDLTMPASAAKPVKKAPAKKAKKRKR